VSPKPKQPDAPKKPAFGPDGLTDHDRAIIRDAIARYPEIQRVTLFGSRAMGTFGRGSDIDLALEGPNLTTATRAKLAADLEDSNLPYKVDVLIRTPKLDKAVEQHIRRYGKPFDWATVQVDEVAANHDGAIAIGPFGSSMKSDDYTDDGVPVVRGNNLVGKPGFYGDFVFVPTTITDRFQRCLVRPGDLVFPHRGAIGEVGLVVDQGYQEWMLSTSMMKLSPDRDKADSRYMYYFFRSDLGRHQLLRNASQVGTPGISRPLTSLRACEMPLPPLPEQRAIAAVLGSLDDKIEQNRRTAGKLEELARAVFRAWFVDFAPVHAKANGAKTFPGLPQQAFNALPNTFTPGTGSNSPLGPIPKGWEVKTIADVVTIKGGGTPSTKNPEYWEGGTHHWTTPKDLSNLNVPVLTDTARKITQAGVDKISSGLLPIGTVLLSSRAPVGYLAIAAVPVAINQGYIAMVCDGQLSPQFILRWAENSMDLIKGNASGTTFAEISKKNFRPLPVVVPPPVITQAFDEVTKPMFDLLVANVHESQKLAELRDYLLPRLLSGTVRVREAEACVQDSQSAISK